MQTYFTNKTLSTILAAIVLIAVLLPVFSLISCSRPEIAFLNDGSYGNGDRVNDCIWAGVRDFSNEAGVNCTRFKPGDGDDLYDVIGRAYERGARVMVCPGGDFQYAVYHIQSLYPDVKFILIDAEPNDGAGNYRTDKNVVCILFEEWQAGFFAGYAAVAEGYYSLGFMGGAEVDTVASYGAGFVGGAEYAAHELGIVSVDMRYVYMGIFDATPEAQTIAAEWHSDGTELIFVAGGALIHSVVSAAVSAPVSSDRLKIIGADVDCSRISDSVALSAVKNYSLKVSDTLRGIYSGEITGGRSLMFGASNGGVALSMETARMKTFTESDYLRIMDKVRFGTMTADGQAIEPVTLEFKEQSLDRVNFVG